MEDLNREIESATEAARQALAQGREPGPHLIRRNALRERLAKMTRADSGATAPVPTPEIPEETVQVPTGRVAEAVPPPPRPEPAQSPPPPVSQPSATSQTSAPRSQGSAPLSQPSGPTPRSGPPLSQPSAGQRRQPGVPAYRPSAPATGAPSAPETSPVDAAVDETLDPVQRLMVWRDRGGHQELKDRHIRQIVNSGARTAAEVAAGLPASLKPLAPAIAGELGLDEATEDSELTGPSGAVEPPQAGPAAGAMADRGEAEPAALNPRAISWQQPDQLAEELARFAAMDFSRASEEPGTIRVAPRSDGNLTLRWPDAGDPAGVTVYRVVSDDDHMPYSPEVSEVIGLTAETSFIDARPFHSAVRHYQVWMNQGPTPAEALLEQPILHAGVPVVAKPIGVDIREDEGRVVGQWTLLGPARRVQIFRVPVERAGVSAGNPMYRICADQANLTGFVDDGAESGRRYLYQLLVEAEVSGNAQLSLPTVVPVTTSARLTAVPDLACQLHEREGAPRFDLEWTVPPQGRVVIYRTAAAPLAGADADTVDESALPQMNLRPEERLNYPSDLADQRASIRDVPWPRDWHRTYFTPVTLQDGRARVGRTASAVHVGTPGDPRIVERVTEQVLTMSWPRGADTVKVYAAPRGGSAEEAIAAGSAVAEISQAKYERLGGLHFPTPLDAHGCSLHLLPMAFSGGQAVHGKPDTVAYRGLLTMHYGLEVRRGGVLGRGAVLLVIRIRAGQANASSPPFALVHHPHRLPLDVSDGEQLRVQWNVERPTQPVHRFRPQSLTPDWSEPGWVAEVTGRTGWVRVFIDFQLGPEHGTVALLDPPVSQLYLGGR